MQIEIDNRDYKKSRNKKTENPVWAVVWRFLLVCAIIDGGIYFYFHKVQNITVSEGIRRIQLAAQGYFDHNDKKNIVHKEYQQKNIGNIKSNLKTNNMQNIEKNNHTNYHTQHSSKNITNSTIQRLDKLYCWADENDILHFSNMGFPSKGIIKVVNCER